MRTVLIFLVALTGFHLSVRALGQTRVPSPTGFIEVSGLSPTLKQMGMAGLLPGQRLLGYYLTTNATAAMLRQGWAVESPFCKAVIHTSANSKAEISNSFQKLVGAAKKVSQRVYDRKRKQTDILMDYFENAANKLKRGVTVDIKGMTQLGSIVDSKEAYGSVALVNISRREGDESANLIMAMAGVWYVKGTQIIQLSVVHPFHSAADVEAAKATLLRWLAKASSE